MKKILGHIWNNRWFRLLLGVVSSVFFLYLAFKDVPLIEVAQLLARADLGWVATGIAIIVLGTWLRAVRWIRLYYPADAGMRVGQMWGISLTGQMLNILFPWRVGEIARIVLASEIEKKSKTQTLATLGVEKIFDTLMLLAILVAIPFFMTLPNWLEESRAGLMVTAALLIGGAITLLISRTWLLNFIGRISFLRARAMDERAQLALTSLDVLKKWNVHLELQALSVLIWFLGALAPYILFLALGMNLPFIASFFLLVVFQVGGYVPASPGRIGVFQYLGVISLKLFDVTQSVALAYSILLYLVAYIPTILLAVIFLWLDRINLRRLTTEPVE